MSVCVFGLIYIEDRSSSFARKTLESTSVKQNEKNYVNNAQNVQGDGEFRLLNTGNSVVPSSQLFLIWCVCVRWRAGV